LQKNDIEDRENHTEIVLHLENRRWSWQSYEDGKNEDKQLKAMSFLKNMFGFLESAQYLNMYCR
jgi:hypothetical protein